MLTKFPTRFRKEHVDQKSLPYNELIESNSVANQW